MHPDVAPGGHIGECVFTCLVWDWLVYRRRLEEKVIFAVRHSCRHFC